MPDYHKQAHCQFIKASGQPCGCIALKSNLFCRHHSRDYTPPSTSIQVKLPKRYIIDNTTQDNLYERNLNSDNIYCLKDEIAILQTHLQSLLSSHCQLSKMVIVTQNPRDKLNCIKQFNRGLNTQLLLIDRLEKLIKMTKDLEFKEKGTNELNLILKTVLAKVVYVINRNIQDIEIKRLIAEELYRISKDNDKLDVNSNISIVSNISNDIDNDINDKDNIYNNININSINKSKEIIVKSDVNESGLQEDKVSSAISSIPSSPTPTQSL